MGNVQVHGHNAYVNHGCRCSVCVTKYKRHSKQRRARWKREFAEGLVDRPHGKLSTYSMYGCRCDLCKKASVEYRERLKARKVRQGQAIELADKVIAKSDTLGDAWDTLVTMLDEAAGPEDGNEVLNHIEKVWMQRIMYND